MEDIVSKLLRIEKVQGWNHTKMADVLKISRQLYWLTRTHQIEPGKKILTFFITGEADRLLETPQNRKLARLLNKLKGLV